MTPSREVEKRESEHEPLVLPRIQATRRSAPSGLAVGRGDLYIAEATNFVEKVSGISESSGEPASAPSTLRLRP
jgi:hypothetical protein